MLMERGFLVSVAEHVFASSICDFSFSAMYVHFGILEKRFNKDFLTLGPRSHQNTRDYEVLSLLFGDIH